MQTIRDVKLSSKHMNVLLGDNLGRGRSIVCVAIGCFLALAAIVCVVGSRVSRFGPDWHWWSGISAPARSERAEAVVANTSSDADAALFAALEQLERQMAAAIASARKSVVALEYTAPDAAPGTRHNRHLAGEG